jgi:SAM-dependent methyltransferase
VLDLACGWGRHTRYLANLGHRVLACDRNADVLGALGKIRGVETLCADLEDGSPWPLAGREFSAIVVTNYLHRPLFPAIESSLAAEGVLIYETFVLGNERHGKPSNPQFLLRRDELLAVFGRSLTVIGYEQGLLDRGKTALIQRLCATRRASLENPLEPRDEPDSVRILG